MRSTGRAPLTESLRQLAHAYGVQTAYYDFLKRRMDASGEAVLEAARLLGAPVLSAEDAPDAIRTKTRETWERVLEPVVVVRPRRPSSIEVRVPEARGTKRLRCCLRLEDGTERRWACDLRRAAGTQTKKVEGIKYFGKRVPIPHRLPPGYHELIVDGTGEVWRSVVIAAPTRAFAPSSRQWGAFLPLYALHSSESWGVGDFSDLARLQEWVGRLGGDMVSMLPVLAAHPRAPFDPSPYAPASRLFWNELHVDPRRVPELAECRGAQRLLSSSTFQQDIASLGAAPQVDYEGQRVLRRRVLAELARWLAESRNARHEELQRYVAAHRSLEDFAAYNAVFERRQVSWPEWPEPLRGGVIGPEDRDPEAVFYHLYVQWLAEQQLAAISSASGAGGKPGLYLDFPLGVHGHGYDTWRYRDQFALDACGGAPPDSVFAYGQNWQFPPLHPEHIRADGYGYFIECLRHQLAHASSLRIDHVMALHRLYWIPRAWPAGEGVYVRYRSDELYAILCLESHRHRAAIVGENLGTVPTHVNAALSRRGVLKMYVAQYETQPTAEPLRRVPAGSVASLNTHDMPPFAGYLRGKDLQDHQRLGLLPKARLRQEQNARRRVRRSLARFFHRRGLLPSPSASDNGLVRASLTWLAASAAAVVLINLEDLWLEAAPQNLPGTGTERPNWRRRARYSLEQFANRPSVLETLRLVADARARGRGRR